jgi:TatD DNase family protein
LHCVLKRADESNVTHMLATPGSLSQLKETLGIARAHPNIYVTAGVHPTRCNEFDADGSTAEDYLSELKALIESNRSKIVAGGMRDPNQFFLIISAIRGLGFLF